MEEEKFSPNEEAGVAESATAVAADAGADSRCLPVTLQELQELEPAALQELMTRLDIRLHPGLTRHQQIYELIRFGIPRGLRVTVDGFLEDA